MPLRAIYAQLSCTERREAMLAVELAYDPCGQGGGC